jgi:hypothetical protein
MRATVPVFKEEPSMRYFTLTATILCTILGFTNSFTKYYNTTEWYFGGSPWLAPFSPRPATHTPITIHAGAAVVWTLGVFYQLYTRKA